MDVRIVGVNLPGRSWNGYGNVHVGIQRRAEVVDLVAGDAEQAVWNLAIDSSPGHDDFHGPYVHGRRGDRFLYLSWGAVGDDGTFAMFRRAKLMLDAIGAEAVAAANEPGQRLVGALALTDGRGGPRCAAVRPPAISWTAAPAG